MIDVWDCRAHLAYVTTKAGGMTMRRVEWIPPLTERQEEALKALKRGGETYDAVLRRLMKEGLNP